MSVQHFDWLGSHVLTRWWARKTLCNSTSSSFSIPEHHFSSKPSPAAMPTDPLTPWASSAWERGSVSGSGHVDYESHKKPGRVPSSERWNANVTRWGGAQHGDIGHVTHSETLWQHSFCMEIGPMLVAVLHKACGHHYPGLKPAFC